MILQALGQSETSTAVGTLVDAWGAEPSEIREQTAGAPVRHVRRLLFDSGGEIVFSNDAVVAVLLHLPPPGYGTRGLHLADWIPGTRNDASLDDLERVLQLPARTAPGLAPYFALDGGYLQAAFTPGSPWRKRGGLMRITVTASNPGVTALPKDMDCATCSDLLVRNDHPHGVSVDATLGELTSALAAGLLAEDPSRVRIADLRPLHDSGLMERPESQLTCSNCGRIVCFTLVRDGAPTFDHYLWGDAVMRPREPLPPVEQWGDAARIAQAQDELQYVDHGRGRWFLLKRRSDLYLHVRYSPIDRSALILLDDSEREAYRTGGHHYLSDLATRIDSDRPYRKESPYYSRDLYRGPERQRYLREVSAATADHTWMAERRDEAGRPG